MEIGDSPFDDEMAEFVPQIQQKALNRNVNLHFPVDFVVANRPDMDFPLETVDEETGIPAGKRSSYSRAIVYTSKWFQFIL